MMRSFAPFSSQNESDRFSSASVVELGEINPRPQPTPNSFRARIKARREAIAREAKERRSGDGQGGGIGNYFRILRYGTKWDILLMAIGIIAGLVTGVAFPLVTLILGNLVNQFGKFFEPGSNVTPEALRVGINGLCKQFLYIFFAKWIVGYISMICWRLSSTRISAAIRLEYITCIFKQDLTYFDTLALTPMPVLGDSKDQLSTDHTNPAVHKPGTPGSVAVAITTVSSIVQQGIGERTGGLFQSASMLVAGFTIALMTNKNLAFVISSIIPVALVLYLLTIPFDVKIEKRIIMTQTKAADLAEEILGTIRTVKSFNAEKPQCAKYDSLLNRAKEQGLRKAPLVGVQHFTGIFIILCAFAICFRHGAKLYESGDIKDSGTIITVFFAAIFGIGGLAGLAVPIQAMSKACSASSIIFQVIDRKPLVDALSKEGHEPYTFPKGDIEMRNIRFAYPGGGDRGKSVVLGGLQRSPFADPELPPSNTLSEGDESNNYRDGGGLSLTFPAGKTTAIIGPSGAGKSTILALLERWYEPQEGSILIGGVDVGEYNLRWWRGKIGLVMQEPFLFNTSIFKNIADGLQGTQWENLPEEEKRKMVHNACIDANAADFIDELPGKYDSIVGENGIKLSGGQKQRIAIARSIISRPSVLLLDEATSALDPVNERLVQKALDRVSKGRTTIMIAHRLSTIKDADKIVVLEEGNIVETGSRKDLLRQSDSAYSRLVRSQELSSVKSHEAPETDPFADPESEYDTEDLERLGHENLHKEDLQNSLIRKKRWRKIGIFKLFALVFSEQRKFLWLTYLFGLIGAIGAGGITPIQSVLYASFMQTFLIVDDMEKFVAQTSFWALMFFCLALGGGFVTFLMGWMFARSSHVTGTHYRSEYFRNVVSQGITYFDKPENSPGDLTSRLSTYPMAIQDLIGAPTGMIISGIITLIASCSLALAICWKLSLVVIAVAVPLNFAAGYIKIKIEKRFVHDSLEVFEESSQFSTEAVGAFRTVSSLVLEEPIRKRYKNLLRKHVKRQSRRIAWSSIMYSAVDSLGILTTAFTWWYGGKLMSTGEISIFQFYLVYLIVLQGADASGHLVGVAHGIAFASISANRMFEVRDLDRKMPGKRMDPGEIGGCEVEFKDANFTYPTRSLRVFEGLNLRIEKGQFAAFVGASGCGKTTTISLLERFYDLREGRILIDGQDLASLDLEGYRDVVSLVSQEPTLYQGTIRENILFGVSGYVTDEEIVQASRDAYLDEFVMTLPDGYNTICGSKGIGLSGGQKQRLAIARALIRKPRMLLLDEATASLDSESEKIVQRALEKAAEGRKMTMIAVAHRLSTIQNADVIFVFDGGRIVEKGDHQTLIRRKGIYCQMTLLTEKRRSAKRKPLIVSVGGIGTWARGRTRNLLAGAQLPLSSSTGDGL